MIVWKNTCDDVNRFLRMTPAVHSTYQARLTQQTDYSMQFTLNSSVSLQTAAKRPSNNHSNYYYYCYYTRLTVSFPGQPE